MYMQNKEASKKIFEEVKYNYFEEVIGENIDNGQEGDECQLLSKVFCQISKR